MQSQFVDERIYREYYQTLADAYTAGLTRAQAAGELRKGDAETQSLGAYGRRPLSRASLRHLGGARAPRRGDGGGVRPHRLWPLPRKWALVIGVTGVGVYIPEGRITSAEIAERSGLPEWVVRDKLGIHAKPAPGPDDHPTMMGVWAAERALCKAGVDPESIDVVISMTEEYKEYPVWTAGIKLAHDLGAVNAYAYDIGQKCGTGVLGLKGARDLLVADESVNMVLARGRLPQWRPH